MRVIKENVGVILQRKLLPVCMAVVLVMGLVSGGGLTAGSTIVINSGVTVTLKSNEADGLFCKGDLTVKGTGRLNCYGSASGLKYNRGTSPATGYAGDCK